MANHAVTAQALYRVKYGIIINSDAQYCLSAELERRAEHPGAFCVTRAVRCKAAIFLDASELIFAQRQRPGRL